MSPRLLWYIPNQARPGHRGDDVVAGHNSLETLTAQATALEEHGWDGALLGTGSTVQPRPAARRARRHPPLEFGLRVTTVVRDTAGEAWADAEDRVAAMAGRPPPGWSARPRTWPRPCATTRPSASPISSCPTPLTCRSWYARATGSCRCCDTTADRRRDLGGGARAALGRWDQQHLQRARGSGGVTSSPWTPGWTLTRT